MILTLTSCKSSSPLGEPDIKKDTVLEYSKGSCLGGRCPVYNIRVYSDGMVVYERKDAQQKRTPIITQLSRDETVDLIAFLDANLNEPDIFKRIRDRPVTVLKYDNKAYQYHASKIDGILKQVNSRIENLVAQLSAK